MKTDIQHLEAILKFLEKKGWDFWGWRNKPDFYWEVANYEGKRHFIIFCSTSDEDFCLKRGCNEDGDVGYSFNDLLASHSMWEKLVEKHRVCDQCGYDLSGEYPDGICGEHIKGGYTPISAYLYHISQCFQLPKEDRLKYAAQFVEGINND